jgi:excinuclease UvrABC nuclease subunit
LKEVMQRRFLWKTQNNKNCPPLWKEGDHEVGEDFYSWNKKIPSAKAVSPLSKGEQNLPDVFVLDWWIGQLNVVKDLCKESSEFYKVFQQVDFVSLWKWEARRKSWIWLASKHWHEWLVWEKIYRFVDDKFNIEEIPLVYDQADRFLVKLRDEAHRFSNSYRKQQMRNELKSEFKKVKK